MQGISGAGKPAVPDPVCRGRSLALRGYQMKIRVAGVIGLTAVGISGAALDKVLLGKSSLADYS